MDFKEGDQVKLIIQRKTNLGFVVEINGSEEGLLYTNDVYVPIETGMKKNGYIKKIRVAICY